MTNKIEVDAAIAELKVENERLVKCRKEYDSRQRIEERIISNGAQQLRATKRALWLARANRANAEWGHWATIWFCDTSIILNINKSSVSQDPYRCTIKRNAAKWRNIWREVERKCLKKAEEYK